MRTEMRNYMEENQLLQDDDLKDLFAELEKSAESVPEETDPEIKASQRRYQEIINKHKEL